MAVINNVNVVKLCYAWIRGHIMESTMATKPIIIPPDLLQLKPSDALESVSVSRLARKGTAVLREVTDKAQAVAVNVQGYGSMVTLSQHQYDEMVELIHRIQKAEPEDGFTQALSKRFDDLVARMKKPGAGKSTEAALFSSPDSLNKAYRPGTTETDD